MRPRRISRLLPPPLLLLLAAVTVVGFAWALVVPAWQSPDEPAHFGYVQTIGEQFELPDEDPGESFSSEQRLAADYSNSLQTAANVLARAEWSELERRRWEAADSALPPGGRSDGGGAPSPGAGNPARTNPPLYYAYEAIPYVAAPAARDIFSRLHLMRFASVVFLLIAVAATWRLVGEVMGPSPLLQLTGASLVGLEPMAVFISSTVNPDSLLIATFAVALLAGVTILRRGLTPANGAALCAATAAAVLTKGTGYALVPAMLLALAIGGARLAGLGRRRALLTAVPVFAVPVGAWLLLAKLAERPAVNRVGGGSGAGPETPGPLGYLWQFYLPKLPFQTTLPGPFPPLPAFDYWVEGFWARFGWLEVSFPEPVYVFLAVVTLGLIAGAALALKRSASRRDLPTVAFVALVAISLLAGLHATEYQVLSSQGTTFNQGRYLLPLLPLLGLAGAGALSLLGGARRAAGAGLLVGGLVALQVFSLALVVVRFHA